MPHRPIVIVNPTAGGGRAARLVPWLRDRLTTEHGARLLVTTAPGEAERVAEAAPGAGHDRIVAVGGDGTVQEIVNGLVRGAGRIGVGIVPVGSGNDLSRGLALPEDHGAAWTIAMGANERAIDLAFATGGGGRSRWFASAGGVGFDAQVATAMASRAGWQRGQAGYLLTTLTELRRFSNRRVELTVDGATSSRSVLFVAIANGEYYGGGMRIAPGAVVDDGALDLCIVGDVSRVTALRQLVNLYRGTHVRHPQVELLRGRIIEIGGDAATLVHLDGEPFGHLPLRVELHAGRLRVAVPDRPSVGVG